MYYCHYFCLLSMVVSLLHSPRACALRWSTVANLSYVPTFLHCPLALVPFLLTLPALFAAPLPSSRSPYPSSLTAAPQPFLVPY